jgi:hypothetical protein
MYTISEVAEKSNTNYDTVKERFRSKYAQSRWGVEEIELPNGEVRRFVPKEKLYLWLEESDHMGRPSQEELDKISNTENGTNTNQE